ncbi:MAG: twin-arginine translocase subunit TatC [Saprospiraceae bacterium]
MPLDQMHEVEKSHKEMSFFEHVAELRSHILRSVAAIGVFAAMAFYNKSFVFDTLLFGPRNPDFLTYRAMCGLSYKLGLGDKMCFTPVKFDILTRQLGEILMQHILISFWLGVICAFPYIIWEVWKFIRPGLHKHEQSAIRGVVFVCSILFLMGVLFGYYVIAPFSINFLAGYTLDGAIVSPTLDSYVTYMTMFTIPTGVIFEMPIIAYFGAKIGVLGPQALRNYRRHAVVAFLILAAIITPPDVVSQFIVMVPLYILYEVSIVVVKRVKKKRDAMLDSTASNE